MFQITEENNITNFCIILLVNNRQRAAAIKGNGTSGRGGPGELKAVLGADVNADLQVYIKTAVVM